VCIYIYINPGFGGGGDFFLKFKHCLINSKGFLISWLPLVGRVRMR